ncbi:hypothetical protein MBLNU457_5800t1 [Dothideomycetes sp. NU457]
MPVTQIYALGSNGSGQLGLGHEDDVSAPALLQLPAGIEQHQVRRITAGGNHTLLVTEAGDVYASGSNADGQCGFGSNKAQSLYFQKVRLSTEQLQDVVVDTCAATWDASVFATDRGVLVCGTGAKGELGLGNGVITAHEPTLIPDFPPPDLEIVGLAACMGHVVAVLSNGDAYGWGVGRHGQLGEPNEDCWAPRKIKNVPFRVAGAVCGKDFTCLFSPSAEGHLIMLGPSKRDRYSIRESVPKMLKDWKSVSASWGSVFVLMPDGSIHGWGRNDHGQLPSQNAPKVVSTAAGSEHVLAISPGGEVSAWGWGEHGNCGLPLDSNSDVKGRPNVFELPSPATAVWSGCATSFVVISGE